MNKTRIAPTPSGFLHLGNAYNFLITQYLAKQYQAKILLRIDDADRPRFRREYLQDIFYTLELLQINIDEGPKNSDEFLRYYTQQTRKQLYDHYLIQLKNEHHLYPCRLSRRILNQHFPEGVYHGQLKEDKLEFEAPDVVWRVKVPQGTLIRFHDLLHGDVEINLFEAMGDFVVRKKDQFAAYQLSSLIDDLHFGVNLIVRGNDLLTSTAAQLYLAQLCRLDQFHHISFAHHSLISSPQGLKLSKSVLGHDNYRLCERFHSLEELLIAIKELIGESQFLLH